MSPHVSALFFIMALLSGCSSLPNNTQTPSYFKTNTSDTLLAQSVKSQRAKEGVRADQSGMVLLGNGVDAFVARAALAQLAEKTLDVQYYLYHSDLSGGVLLNQLWLAAERGVRVRVLLDDMDMSGRDRNLAILNAHPNIEIRLFNPFIRGKNRTHQLLTRFGSVTRRMHNKSFTVDNQITIIGGRNIGDEYFGAAEDVAFSDLDVALNGPVVQQVSTSFDLYWNTELSYPVDALTSKAISQDDLLKASKDITAFVEKHKTSAYAERLRNSSLVEQAKTGSIQWYWGSAEALYDDPMKISASREKTKYHLAPRLGRIIDGVENELIIISPYFVPGKEGIDFFKDLINRGVKVRILTNSLASNDVSIVHAGYSRYRKRLLEAGVELYEMDDMSELTKKQKKAIREARSGSDGSKSSLHAKYFILDRKQAFIGSLNLDPRSFIENTEIGAIINAEVLAKYLAKHFDQTIHDIAFSVTLHDGDIQWDKFVDGKNITWDTEPNTTWWMRFKVGFMRILPGESQL